MSFFIRMGANAVAILPISYLLPQIVTVDGVMAALAAAFVLGLVNAVVRPLFVLLTLPITVVSAYVCVHALTPSLFGMPGRAMSCRLRLFHRYGRDNHHSAGAPPRRLV